MGCGEHGDLMFTPLTDVDRERPRLGHTAFCYLPEMVIVSSSINLCPRGSNAPMSSTYATDSQEEVMRKGRRRLQSLL